MPGKLEVMGNRLSRGERARRIVIMRRVAKGLMCLAGACAIAGLAVSAIPGIRLPGWIFGLGMLWAAIIAGILWAISHARER